MNIKALFFAKIRELAGVDEVAFQFSGSLDKALIEIGQRFESLREMVGQIVSQTSDVAVAVNAEIVQDLSYLVQDGDEIAFIPPISGG